MPAGDPAGLEPDHLQSLAMVFVLNEPGRRTLLVRNKSHKNNVLEYKDFLTGLMIVLVSG